jgi:hypothetical protein
MARTEARIFTSIWKDEDFLALPPGAQRLYMFLLSQEDLTYCGVIPLRERRWASKAAGITSGEIEQDLKVLEADGRQFVITDTLTGELLIRSFMRNDEIWKQPNLMKAARAAAAQVESDLIRAALLAELQRIPAAGSSSKFVRDVHAAFLRDLTEGSPNPSENPPPNPPSAVAAGQTHHLNPSENPSGNPSANPKANPTGQSSPDPSQERGEGYGLNKGLPPSPNPSLTDEPEKTSRKGSRKGSANPSTEAHAGTVVAAFVEGATNAGLNAPSTAIKARVGRAARQLLSQGYDVNALIESAQRMGASEYDDLDKQVRIDDARAKGAASQGSSSRHRAYQNPTDDAAYEGSL